MHNFKSFDRKYFNVLVILVFLFFFSGRCQKQDSASEVQIRKTNASVTEEEFQKYLEDVKNKNNLPGIAAAVLTSQGIIHSGVFGVRSLDSGELITLGDRFHIGSNTKAMTGFLAGILVDKNLIQWNSKILDVFPEFKLKAKKEYGSITLRDVLSHRAGILPFKSQADFIKVPEFEGTATKIRKEFTLWLLQQEPVGIETQGFTYSNAGYCVAAAVIERVSKTSWELLIQEELFDPLEIGGQIHWPAFNDTNQPLGHWIRGGQLVSHDPHDEYQLPEILRPAGDVNMSILDYAKWLQTILKGINGEDTIIQSETCDFLLYGNMEFSPYSMGWGSSKRDGLTISSHDGSAGTFYCHAVVIKELDLAIAIFANSATKETSKGVHEFTQKIINRYKSDNRDKEEQRCKKKS